MYDQALFDKLERGSEKITESGCWVWMGFTLDKRPHPGNRYGQVGVKFPGYTKRYGWKNICTHRAMMLAIHGEAINGQCVCHRCDVPQCVNPAHLFFGTMGDNIRDSRAKGRHYEASLTHCHRGHPLSGDNVYIAKQGGSKTGFHRACIICHRARHRIRAGWPEDLAYTLPVGKTGYRPDFNAGSEGNGRADP